MSVVQLREIRGTFCLYWGVACPPCLRLDQADAVRAAGLDCRLSRAVQKAQLDQSRHLHMQVLVSDTRRSLIKADTFGCRH
jgi:hypothetical protein